MSLPDKSLAEFFRVPVFLPVDYDGREILGVARISNLSSSGCFIAVSKPLPVGATVELRFQLPGIRELFICQGYVRWSQGSPVSQRPVPGRALGMGVEFRGLARKQRTQLKQFIRAFILEMRARAPST